MCSNEDEKGPKSAAILSSRGVSSEAMSLNFHINSQNNMYDIDSPPSRARFRRGRFECDSKGKGPKSQERQRNPHAQVESDIMRRRAEGSEARRGGSECDRTWRSRWAPFHKKTKTK